MSLVTPTRSYAVDVRTRLTYVFRSPGGGAFARFGRFNVNGVPTVFAALEAVTGCKAAWYRVLVPLKPHGQTGYVRARDVGLRPLRTRLVVDLSTRRLTVFERGRPVLGAKVAIGARSTPTPTGRFYVNQRFRDDPLGPYGWAADAPPSAPRLTLRGRESRTARTCACVRAVRCLGREPDQGYG